MAADISAAAAAAGGPGCDRRRARAASGDSSGCDDALAPQWLGTALAALEERLGMMLEEHQRILLANISAEPAAAARSSRRLTTIPRSSRRMPAIGSESQSTQGYDNRASVEAHQTRMKTIKTAIMRGSATMSNLSAGAQGAVTAKSYARQVQESKWFELGVAVCIAANTVSIGFNADWSIKNPGRVRPMAFEILDYCFLGVFALELLVRMLSEGAAFYKPGRKEFSWNVFDTLIVVVTSLNELNPLKMNLSVVRALRPLRLVHAVRMIRILNAFRELRMMVTGILNCGKTLLWSSILLTLVSYVYSVFCLQLCADWLGSLDEVAAPAPGDSKLRTAIEKHFSSLPWCTYALFKAMTNGVTWGDELADPLWTLSPAMVFSFVLYITVTVLCVLNVITAAFVEAAARTRQDDDASMLHHIQLRKDWMDKITDLFDKHDTDQDGSLNWEEFESVAMDWRTQAFFREHALDFDFQNARQLFRLFDWDKSGHINIDEFAQGIYHLKGNARSLDMFRQFYQLGQKVEAALQRLEKGESRAPPRTSRCMARPLGSAAGGLGAPSGVRRVPSGDSGDGALGGIAEAAHGPFSRGFLASSQLFDDVGPHAAGDETQIGA